MAKFEDYIQKEDELQQEIDTAQKDTQDRKDNPAAMERFKDKSPEEIVQSYEELEKLYSRQANDLGEMRKEVDKYVNLQSDINSNNEDLSNKEPNPVTIDELYDNPQESIERVAESKLGSRIEELEQRLQEEKASMQAKQLQDKYPELKDPVQQAKFKEWAEASTYRTRMAQVVAETGDYAIAEELVGEWHNTLADNKQADLERQLDDASLEGTGSEYSPTDKKYSRREIISNKTRAAQGDYQASDWLAANANDIALAYEEGRVTD